jgi:hypothetical protein
VGIRVDASAYSVVVVCSDCSWRVLAGDRDEAGRLRVDHAALHDPVTAARARSAAYKIAHR